MIKKQLLLLIGCIGMFCSAIAQTNTAPKPYGPLPSESQLNWQQLEMISIVHFGLNTFTDKEWGSGGVDPKVFKPNDFDPDQIVLAAKSAGIKGMILVAKHHDGFCLWPTKTTDYNITKSPWKNGRGDMVKDFEEACRRHGLQFGLYCSPWDRNSEFYGDFKYVQLYREQLKELYSNYGELFESWFDGANGGDGYYGGANEVRKIGATYYGWDTTWAITRKLQPGAVIFSDIGPDIRYVGNEKGLAADTTWETHTPHDENGGAGTFGSVIYEELPYGKRDGKFWMPAECDVPLRPGWFYHEDQEGKEKTPSELFNIYIHSVGRAANMNLGLAPDKEGKLSINDANTLKSLGELINKTFSENLAKGARLKPSNIRGNDSKNFGPENLLDNDRYSYWATDDKVSKPNIVVDLQHPKTFNIIQLRENIKLGQRIFSISVDKWEKGRWKEIATAVGIGANRLIRLDESITTDKIRLRINSPVCIALSEIGIYAEAK